MGILTYIFLILAASCNAIMDTLQHHFSTSIFKNKNPKFWNPNVSWQFVNFLPFTKYRADAWHLAKSVMVINICISIVFFNGYWWEFFIFGTVWNLTFNLFYNKILKNDSQINS
jgi:hypothetical protein